MNLAAAALRICAGILVWGAHFATVYAVTALACARGWASAVPWAVGTATLAAATLALAILVREARQRARFESWLAASVAAVALFAILYEALPVLIVPACV